MILSDSSILNELHTGAIEIHPWAGRENIRPTGVRVHLADDVLIPRAEFVVDLTGDRSPHYDRAALKDEGMLLPPGGFLLGATREALRVRPDLLCHLDGRSTLARLGLLVHCSSGVVDNNTDEARSIVLELYNCGPFTLRLRSGMPVGMVTFTRLTSPIEQRDQAQYQGQEGVRPPDLAFHATRRRSVGKPAQAALAAGTGVPMHAPAGYECPFCQLAAGHPSQMSGLEDTVYRDELVFALVASHWWPNNPGAVLVVTREHFENIYDLPDRLGARVFAVSRRIATAMKAVYRCEGTSVRQHNEPAGGQDVWHFHQHVFPRYEDDQLYQLTDERRLAPGPARKKYAAQLREALQT